MKLMMSFVALVMCASPAIAFADCRDNCLEMSSECNSECPTDQPAGAACHALCQVLYNKCIAKCAPPKEKSSREPSTLDTRNEDSNLLLSDNCSAPAPVHRSTDLPNQKMLGEKIGDVMMKAEK